MGRVQIKEILESVRAGTASVSGGGLGGGMGGGMPIGPGGKKNKKVGSGGLKILEVTLLDGTCETEACCKAISRRCADRCESYNPHPRTHPRPRPRRYPTTCALLQQHDYPCALHNPMPMT